MVWEIMFCSESIRWEVCRWLNLLRSIHSGRRICVCAFLSLPARKPSFSRTNCARLSSTFLRYTGVLSNLVLATVLSASFAIRQLTVYKELRDNLKERPWCTKDTCAVSNDSINQIVSQEVCETRIAELIFWSFFLFSSNLQRGFLASPNQYLLLYVSLSPSLSLCVCASCLYLIPFSSSGMSLLRLGCEHAVS